MKLKVICTGLFVIEYTSEYPPSTLHSERSNSNRYLQLTALDQIFRADRRNFDGGNGFKEQQANTMMMIVKSN